MEKITLVSQKHGRKPRHGTVGMIGGVCFATVPVRALRRVYFAIPGADEDFLQVAEVEWNGKAETLDAVLTQAVRKIESSDPQGWVDTFSATTLEEVRNKTLTAHREYLFALLAEHKAFTGKDWK